jgi:transcriptional regulator with XRE-family HTH domain
MISAEQIKAGRALLNWNQEDLAARAEVSVGAINNMERRTVLPRARTLQRIQATMEAAGVEFLEGPGVRLRGEVLQVRLMEGQDAVFRLFEDITQSMTPGQVMLWSGVDERHFVAAGEERFTACLDKWVQLGLDSKVLSRHGDTFFVDYREHYRWVPQEEFSSIPHVIYGDRLGIILWKPIQRVLLLTSKPITESYRTQFEATWKRAAIPPGYLKSSYHTERRKNAGKGPKRPASAE